MNAKKALIENQADGRAPPGIRALMLRNPFYTLKVKAELLISGKTRKDAAMVSGKERFTNDWSFSSETANERGCILEYLVKKQNEKSAQPKEGGAAKGKP